MKKVIVMCDIITQLTNQTINLKFSMEICDV
jgi:hypothetical protein